MVAEANEGGYSFSISASYFCEFRWSNLSMIVHFGVLRFSEGEELA